MVEEPITQRIARELRDQISSGERGPGSLLPSEPEIARQFEVSRQTARSAFQILEQEGLIEAVQRRGRIVRPRTQIIHLGNDRYSPRHRETGLSPFLLECAKQGRTGRFEVLSIERTRPSPEVAERLGVANSTESVLKRENVFYADADPVECVTTYIPWSIAEDTGLLQEEIPHQFGIHGVLEERGHVMTRMREDTITRMPTPEEVRLLNLKTGVPVLDLWHTSLDQNGEPYELTRFVMRGDMTGLRYDVPIE
ncbi:MAG: GntR family transcriptional regulator [Nocardiopsaceae bacterium]|nr:GntR family transcriptional regulator [Nocardiopsaceae bacterium]